YQLIFTFLVVTKTGLPGFHIENISRFQALEDCEKTKTSMVEYMDRLVQEGKMFPGVFECRKI
ncbi:MAG: hypothetical protein EBQ97_07260, partial [Bacteroidetes bacterium]|nr:hypothetical protein [Bacteroidota bacterium]